MACVSSVGTIVLDICSKAKVFNVNTDAIDDIECRGFKIGGDYSAADSLRALQRAYFFDLVEIDGLIVAVIRGANYKAVIYRTDMVRGQGAKFETAREQAVEFPKKLHLTYSSAETDYTPTKQTSERRSDDIKALSEVTVEVPINLDADEAAQIADAMHKTAWAEHQGTTSFAVSERFNYLTASDPILVEASSGVFRRVRIQKTVFVDGVLQVDAVIDRHGGYASTVTAPIPVDPEDPTTNLPGATSYEIMDLPVLVQQQDDLNLYFAAYGSGAIWNGSIIDRQYDTAWIEVGRINYPSTIGTTDEALPVHASGLDTTNSLLVTISDDDIATITQAEFDIGGNLALVDDELINFKTVVAEGSGYRISYLNRGALNTTPATNAIGSRFVKLDAPTAISMASGDIGENIKFRVYSVGTIPAVTDETTITYLGNSQIEWAPLDALYELVSGDWTFSWTHNKRIGAPNDAIISQHWRNFAVELNDGTTTEIIRPLNRENNFGALTYTDSEQIEDFGSAITSWTTARVYGENIYTGAGLKADFAPPPNLVFVVDTFTDTNGVAISSHTPDIDYVGGGWITDSGAMTIQSNSLLPTNLTTSDTIRINAGGASAVISVSGICSYVDLNNRGVDYILIHVNSALTTGYRIEISPGFSTNNMTLYEIDGATTLDDITIPEIAETDNTAYDVVVTVNGTTITAVLTAGGNDYEVTSAACTDNAADTTFGIQQWGKGSYTMRAFDNFNIIQSTYDPLTMTYDGSTGYYSKTGIEFNSNQVTGVARFNIAPFTGDTFQVLGVVRSLANNLCWYLSAYSSDYSADTALQNKIVIIHQNTAYAIVSKAVSIADGCDSSDHVVFAAYDGSAGTAIFYMDGVNADDTGWANRVAPTTGTIGFAGASGSTYVGALYGPANYVNGEIGYFGYRSAYLTNPTDFYHPTNGLQVLDTSTWTEWGAQPEVFTPDGKLDTNNLGSLGAFTKNGTITGPA